MASSMIRAALPKARNPRARAALQISVPPPIEQAPYFECVAHSLQKYKKPPLYFQSLAHSFALTNVATSVFPVVCALLYKNMGGGGYPSPGSKISRGRTP